MNRPKQHHYLPQSYLEGFYGEGETLALFDRERKEFRNQNAFSTGKEKDLYTYLDGSGTAHTDIENPMFSDLEGVAKGVIAKAGKGELLNEDEASALALFVSFFHGRVPSALRDFRELYEALSSRMASDFAHTLAQDQTRPVREREAASRIAEDLMSGARAMHPPKGLDLTSMLDVSSSICEILLQQNWVFLHANPRTSFVTSDRPFTLLAPPGPTTSFFGGIGVATPGAQKFIPLSQSLCLCVGDPGRMIVHHEIDKTQVREINLRIAYHSERFVIGRHEALIKSLVEKLELETRSPARRWTIE